MKRSVNSQNYKMSQPVFIVGVPRSGTSMLYDILVRLSDFRGVDESCWDIETSIFKKYIRHMDDFFKPGVRPFWFEYYSGKREYFENFLLDSCRSFLINAARARKARRILEKTPNHIECLDFIVKAFPEAKFVHIYRHPVDIYASMRKRDKITPTDKDPWLRVNIPDFGQSYNEKISKAMNFPCSIFHVRYEELTKEPEKLVEKICDFLGTPYSIDCLKGEIPDKNNRIFPIQSNVPMENFGDWRTVMTKEEVIQLESICLDTMVLLGYAKYEHIK